MHSVFRLYNLRHRSIFEAIAKRRNRIFCASAALLLFTAALLSAPDSGSRLEASAAIYAADPALGSLLSSLESKTFSAKVAELRKFRQAKREAALKSKSAYVLARLLQKAGSSQELAEALGLFQEAGAYGPLYQRASWHRVEIAGKTGDEILIRQVLEEMRQRLEKDSDREKNGILQIDYSLAQSFMRSGETESAAAEFERIVKSGPESQWGIGSRYYLGQLACAKKNFAEAMKQWRIYLDKSPDGRFVPEIVSQLAKPDYTLQASDHVLLAQVYFVSGQWKKAINEWKLGGADPGWYKQGLCLLRSGQQQEGKQVLIAGIKANSNDENVEAAARLLARIGSRQEAIEVWQLLLSLANHCEDAALYNLAIRSGEAESLAYYSRLLAKFPDSDYAAESAWWLAWHKIKSGKNAEALGQLKAAAGKYEKSKAASRLSYWAAKLEEKLGQKDAAKKAYALTAAKFPLHYYGFRAAARLQALSGKSDPGWQTSESKNLSLYAAIAAKGGWSSPLPPKLVSYGRIAEAGGSTLACLAELRQWDECLDLLADDKLAELKAACLAKMNLPLESINTAAKGLGSGPEQALRRQLAYPLLHWSTVGAEASAKHVDPLLAQGLIREESRYNVWALSSSKAIGLMQLLPSTAMGVAKRLGVKVNGHDDIHKPENNIKFGVDYLAYTLKRSNGNAMLAVAGYNGGPNAVASWTRKYSLADPDYFVENIPYTETRDYVRKVFGSYWNYQSVYEAAFAPKKAGGAKL